MIRSTPGLVAVIPPITPRTPPTPTVDFHQTDHNAVLSIFTKRTGVDRSCVVAEVSDRRRDLRVIVRFPSEQRAFHYRLRLSGPALLARAKLRASPSGKVEVVLVKSEPFVRWANAGEVRAQEVVQERDLEQAWRRWTLVDRVPVTHDVDRDGWKKGCQG